MQDSKHPFRIMLVEDDKAMHALLKDHLEQWGCELMLPASSLEAFEILAKTSPHSQTLSQPCPHLIITDLQMPEKTGLDILSQAQRFCPQSLVILITAHASLETAVQALRQGAYDYITKPFKLAELTHTLQKAKELLGLKQENKKLQLQLDKSQRRSGLLGKSSAMQELFQKIDRFAAAVAPVLIQGESGTGKELVARSLHEQSPHHKGPFVAVNCSAIPGELIESEFFGHIKGAFSGATSNSKGLLESANSGTLFLDEIGDLPAPLQAKLLRVLQDGRFRPVGSTQEVQANFRLISATHKDLIKMIQQDTFREDLFYRISVLPLNLAPLRSRPEDLEVLIPHFLKRSCLRNSQTEKQISPEAMSWLLKQEWPGNVRELENTIERLVILSTGPQIVLSDLEFLNLQGLKSEKTTESQKLFDLTPPNQHFETLEQLESRYVRWILQQTGFNKQLASQILGVHRRTLLRWEKQGPNSTANKDEELTSF